MKPVFTAVLPPLLLLSPELPLLLLRLTPAVSQHFCYPAHSRSLTSSSIVHIVSPPSCSSFSSAFPFPRPVGHSFLPSCLQDNNDITSTMLVTQDYSALKENEICVSQGETIQVMATNQQNMYLVYRPANSQSPAAEGWVPGHVLGPLTKPIKDSSSTCSFSAAVTDANNIK